MRYLLTLLFVVLIPTAALAQGECHQERKKFCPNNLKKAELWACLSKHEAELGAPCKAKIKAKAKGERAKEKAGAPSANYSSPSTDTQPQPTYPYGRNRNSLGRRLRSASLLF